MRKIEITDSIMQIASDYASRLESGTDFNNGSKPKEKLKKLVDELKKPSTDIQIQYKVGKRKARYRHHKGGDLVICSDYVQAIIDNYDGLNNLLPSKYKSITDIVTPKLNATKLEFIWVKLKGRVRRPFYELIVEAMCYEKVRGKIMVDYIPKLGIGTCIYCNAQFAITASVLDVKQGRNGGLKIDHVKGAFYELDHNLAKSKYPYLCTNFYNLQPCCGSCNRRKLDADLEYSLYWEKCDGTPYRPLHFAIGAEDLIDFRINNKCKDISAKLCNAGTNDAPTINDDSLADKFNQMFGIQGIYDEHKDIVQEFLWNHKIYSKGLWEALMNQIPELGLTDEEQTRIILGTYSEEKDAYRRPLTILIQDLWNQLGKE